MRGSIAMLMAAVALCGGGTFTHASVAAQGAGREQAGH
jgi:hypothetical protein